MRADLQRGAARSGGLVRPGVPEPERGHHRIAEALPGVRQRHALRRVVLTPDASLMHFRLAPAVA